jgi:SAM-dependent methyltransferase
VHENSRLLFERHALAYFRAASRVLELGPDGFPSAYRQSVEAQSGRTLAWDTLDLFRDERLTFVAPSEYSFPIESGSYDVVLSGQVIEHVRKPWVWMREVARVCKAGGIVITINPVSWPYHEAPIDCWRAFPEGIRALYEDASLEVLVSQWGSLELEGFKRYVPGASEQAYGRRRRLVNRILGRLGLPVERAYDTVTIGRKSEHPLPATN